MKPFLYQVATLFYEQYGSQISRLSFVFPNRRAGLFFQKYLSEIAGHPLFSPSVLTINDLFMRLSGKRTADRINMLFLLYDIYVRHSHSTETFDEFLYWGEMLLNDFNDVDKYMVDAERLFSNISDLKEIEAGFDYLEEEQIEAIRSFWSSFNPKKHTPNQDEFLKVWTVLFPVYKELKSVLASQGLGYEGMIYREVLEQLRGNDSFEWPYEKVVFVGLNALSTVEEEFLTFLKDTGRADFYWDYVSPKVKDPNNKAYFFVNRNMERYPSQWQLPKEETVESEIKVIGVPSGVGQAKYTYDLLESFCENESMSSDKALRTAVILPDEQLLVPVLNAIPETIRRINVTMGYPLSGTPVVSFMDAVFSLQQNIRYREGVPRFYFRDVLAILNHRYVTAFSTDEIALLIKDITDKNKMYLSAAELGKTPLLEEIFQPVASAADFSDYLIAVLQSLNRQLSSLQEEEEDRQLQRANDLEQEYIFHYFSTVNRMKEMMSNSRIEMRLDTYFRLLKRITDMITIPFHGEPLSGLQIMGVLETRALDFDRVIILSMNEGIFPMKKTANSFIPYNLRKGFGLPTYEHQDSIWAYHFYRLIHRASQVFLIYDTRTGGMQTGEVSRFVHQLRYHYKVNLHDQLVVFNVLSNKTPALQVNKSPEVLQMLSVFRKGEKRALSASAINTYIDCPLKFYFSTVENLREEEEVSEIVESNDFGTVLHKVMEELYNRFRGQMVTADLLRGVLKDEKGMTEVITSAFSSEYLKSTKVYPLVGKYFLIGEIIRQYVKQVIEQDCKVTPFRYIDSEKKVHQLFTLNDQSEINLKGSIDRVDEVNHRVRIIDYKTGKGEPLFSSIDELFDKEEENRPSAVMQVFMYCMMYGTDHPILPSIYYLRRMFTSDFDYRIYFKKGEGRMSIKKEVLDYNDYKADFEKGLRDCLSEIFDKDVPFIQTSFTKRCSYCPFKSVCGR